jgi:predicted RNA binding protein YcfA (HicA-like mRNA interferase family)
MPVSGRQIVAALQRRSWVILRIRGSHYIMRSPGGIKITIPVHGHRDLPAGTLAAILKSTGLTREEL